MVDRLSQWFDKWLLTVNVEKSAVLAFCKPRSKPICLSITVAGSLIPQVSSHRHLGVIVNDRLTWCDHIQAIISKAAKRIGILRRYQAQLPALSIRHVYCLSVRPVLEYASLVWSGLSKVSADHLESIQRKAACLISGISPSNTGIPHNILLARAGLTTLSSRRQIEQAVFAFKFVHRIRLPDHLLDTLSHWTMNKSTRCASLRQADNIRLPRAKKAVLQQSPLYISLSLSSGNALS